MCVREPLNFRMKIVQQAPTVNPPLNGKMPPTIFMTDGPAASAICHFQEQAGHYLLLEGIHVSFV